MSTTYSRKAKEPKKKYKITVLRGQITPQRAYRLHILQALVEARGSARMSDVLNNVFNKMKDQLKPKDMEKPPKGLAIRWKNGAQWERLRLINEGYLKKDSPRGIWEITEAGRKLYEKMKERK